MSMGAENEAFGTQLLRKSGDRAQENTPVFYPTVPYKQWVVDISVEKEEWRGSCVLAQSNTSVSIGCGRTVAMCSLELSMTNLSLKCKRSMEEQTFGICCHRSFS